MLCFLIQLLLLPLLFGRHHQKLQDDNMNGNVSQTYVMKHDDEMGCSYMAAWFLHINRFRKISFYIDIARAEAATGEVFKSVYHRYLFANFSNYFVHHMSMYEHMLTRHKGFEYAQGKVSNLAIAARKGECSHLDINNFGSKNMGHVAMIPFYGGKPPARNASDEIGTLGQGNSVVSAETKATQCIAAICSSLKYFGHVVVGTSRSVDRVLLTDMLATENVALTSRVTILEFNVTKNVHQIFHLIVWMQHYLKIHNCWSFQRKQGSKTRALTEVNSTVGQHTHTDRLLKSPPWWKGKLRPLLFDESSLVLDSLASSSAAKENDLYEICMPGAISRSYVALTPINVTYMTPRRDKEEIEANPSGIVGSVLLGNYPLYPVHKYPIKYIYYTEADQILRFDSIRTFDVITTVTNESHYLTGYRREKHWKSDPNDYMGSLDRGRKCGQECFNIAWPSSKQIIEC